MVFAVIFWAAVLMIFYHLLGYPLLLALFASLRKNPVHREEFLPFISIIVPAYNEGAVIREKIVSIIESDYPADHFEIIVPEDGSDDNTAEQVLAVKDPRVILDHTPARGGKMAAITRAVGHARGDILVFTDANAILRPTALRNLVSNFADPRVGCVSGHKRTSGKSTLEVNENFYWRYESWIKAMESSLGSTPAAVGELMAVRRELFEIPKGKIINDDFQIAVSTVRQGFRAVYDATAETVEKGSGSTSDEYSRKSRIAAGRWQLAGQVLRMAPHQPGFVLAFLSHKLLRLFILPLMAVALVSSLVAVITVDTTNQAVPAIFALRFPWGQAVLALQGLFYILALFGALFEQRGVRYKLFYLPYYFINAQIAAMGGAYRFFSGRQSVLWRKVSR